jgi:hypothetical protein
MLVSGAFGASIYAQDGQEIYKWDKKEVLTINGEIASSGIEEGPVVQMKNPVSPKSINILRDSYMNGAVTNYNFIVTPVNFMSDGDLITI